MSRDLIAPQESAFRTHVLADGSVFLQGELPAALRLDAAAFARLWDSHPAEYARIPMHGKLVATPRWVQAFGGAYHHVTDEETSPVPAHLAPYLAWGRRAIDPRLNSVFVNWYDAALGHYIGPHRDYRSGMAAGSPIVTISFGEDRVFRLKPWRRPGATLDFAARDGTVFVIPYDTNLAWTHEVPRLARNRGRRISVTLRALTGKPGA
jgi:alkylated DNA repair dioxygenase AlkB